eukprot:SAG22_NODE_594_length_8738_cov_20.249219_6_plen_113_part_00
MTEDGLAAVGQSVNGLAGLEEIATLGLWRLSSHKPTPGPWHYYKKPKSSLELTAIARVLQLSGDISRADPNSRREGRSISGTRMTYINDRHVSTARINDKELWGLASKMPGP